MAEPEQKNIEQTAYTSTTRDGGNGESNQNQGETVEEQSQQPGLPSQEKASEKEKMDKELNENES